MTLKLGGARQLRTVRLGDHSQIALSANFDWLNEPLLRATSATVAQRRCVIPMPSTSRDDIRR